MNTRTARAPRQSGPASTLCVPVECWPALDRRAWEAALKKGDCFEPGGVASNWPPSRLRQVQKGYGRYLHWLSHQGMLDATLAPADRITKDRLTGYLAELRRLNAGFTIADRIQELGDALRALAPERDWRWILRAAGRLRSTTIPARDIRARIRPVEDLVQLGFALMAEAEHEAPATSLQRALAFRDGLIIAFLSFHPIRLKNLSMLEYGRHITSRGDRFWMSIGGAEMKNHRPFECEIAEQLTQPLRRYLSHYRPLLLTQAHGRPSKGFWISAKGSSLSAGRIEKLIRRRTSAAGLPPMSPHAFRHCAATTVAVHRPELVDILPGVLNHSSRATNEKFYNMAGMVEASRAHSDLIEELSRDEGHP
jgi:integrase/recombinase XerD